MTAAAPPHRRPVPAAHLPRPRELDVLRLRAKGHTTDAAADALGISRHTAGNYARHAYGRLGCSTIGAAIALLDDALPGWRSDGWCASGARIRAERLDANTSLSESRSSG